MNAAMEAAVKNKADIIIQFSNSGGQFYAGNGLEDGFEAKVLAISKRLLSPPERTVDFDFLT